MAALIADNTSRAISPQDLRDFMETFRPGHAEIYVSTPAPTSFAEQSTWYEGTDGTYTLSANAMNWAETQNGRLYYTGTADRVVHIAMSFSVTASGNNKIFRLGIGKGGTVLAASPVRRLIATGADVGTGAAHGFVTISNGEYIVPMVRNDSDTTTTLTLQTCNLFVMDMPL